MPSLLTARRRSSWISGGVQDTSPRGVEAVDHAELPGRQEQPVRRDPGGERHHADEGLVPACLAPEREHLAAFHGYGPEVVAGQGPAGDAGLGVDQVHRQQLVTGGDDVLEGRVGLGHDVDRAEPGRGEVHTHDPAERGCLVGVQQEALAVRADEAVDGAGLVDEAHGLADAALAVLGRDRVEPHPVLLRGALVQVQHEPAAVVGQLRLRDHRRLVGELPHDAGRRPEACPGRGGAGVPPAARLPRSRAPRPRSGSAGRGTSRRAARWPR